MTIENTIAKIYYFGNLDNEDLKKVIESKDPCYAYTIARDFAYLEEEYKEELFKIVFESGNKYYLELFLEYVEFNREKFENYLLFI